MKIRRERVNQIGSYTNYQEDLEVVHNLNVIGSVGVNTLFVRGDIFVAKSIIAKEIHLDGHLLSPTKFNTKKLFAWGSPTQWLIGMFLDGRQVTFSETKIKVSCKAFTVDQWMRMTDTRLAMWSEDGVEWMHKNRETMSDIHKALVKIHK